MKYKLVLNILLFISFNSFAQRIIGFNLFQADNSVIVKFTIVTGASCSGYKIWHSSDSLTYVPIEDYPSICGASGANEDKSFTHSTRFNATNFYKVELIPYETTPVQRIYVSENPKATLLVYPNPVLHDYENLTLKLLNTSNIRVIGFLYNQSGNPIRFLDLNTRVDLTTMETGNLSNGLYLIWLTDGTKVYSAKFIIHR